MAKSAGKLAGKLINNYEIYQRIHTNDQFRMFNGSFDDFLDFLHLIIDDIHLWLSNRTDSKHLSQDMHKIIINEYCGNSPNNVINHMRFINTKVLPTLCVCMNSCSIGHFKCQNRALIERHRNRHTNKLGNTTKPQTK